MLEFQHTKGSIPLMNKFSYLFSTSYAKNQYQVVVKLHGVFPS